MDEWFSSSILTEKQYHELIACLKSGDNIRAFCIAASCGYETVARNLAMQNNFKLLQDIKNFRNKRYPKSDDTATLKLWYVFGWAIRGGHNDILTKVIAVCPTLMSKLCVKKTLL